MIALLDYGSGNIRSVHKALEKAGAAVQRVTGPEELADAQGAVLPGVGAFDDCVQALRQQKLLDGIRGFIESGKPFLGICVGYQVLFERSEEFNSKEPGLGVFRGRVVRFPERAGLKIPQIGWNHVECALPGCPLFDRIPDKSHFYFVHSYYPRPEDPGIIASRTDYAEPFASAVWKANVYATQFHPEKSQGVGIQLLKNFVGLLAP